MTTRRVFLGAALAVGVRPDCLAPVLETGVFWRLKSFQFFGVSVVAIPLIESRRFEPVDVCRAFRVPTRYALLERPLVNR